MSDIRRTATLIAAAFLWGSGLLAQTPADSALRRQQRTLDSLVQVLRSLQARIDSLARAKSGGDTAAGDELAALRAAAATTANDSAAAAVRPQQARLGQNALNPEISVTGDIRTSGYRNTVAPNFVAREFEVGLQSALDPYTTAKVTVSFEGGSAHIEEGYLFFPVLPGHIRLDVGRFRQEVGELNRWHLHAVPEDEYPLVVRRFSGGDGIAGTGISLYYALPFSGKAGTYELYVQGTTGDDSLLYVGGHHAAINSKLAAFWQLSRSTYLMASFSGAYGTNPDTGLTTRLGVVAARLTWRPPERGTSREFTIRGELWSLQRRFSGVGETRLGAYAGATWKMGPRWIVGVRGDWVQSPDPVVTAHEWALTPTLTYWQSEFVFLRALWEHARDITGAARDRLTLQAVFAMGPHKHELF